MAIQDSTFFAVRDLLSNDPSKTFEDCVVTLGQHNTMFVRPVGTRQLNNSQQGKQGGRGNGGHKTNK